MEDHALIGAAKAGDEAAFEALYYRNRQAVAHLVYRYTGNYQDTEELLQEIFVKSFLALPDFECRPGASFFSWLLRIAVNTSINFARKRRREKPSAELPAWSGDEAPRVDNPETACLASEFRALFAAGLERLSPRQRMIFTLKHFQGLSLEEIAAQMSCGAGSVRKQFHRAIVKLRKELSPLWKEEAS